MFETYDTNQKAYVERTGQYYDLQQKAWVDVPSAMTYDTTEKAWIERLRASYELTVASGFYDNTGNSAQLQGNNFNAVVKPPSGSMDMTLSLKEKFINPVFYCEFTFGNSDFMKQPTNYRSHSCVYWWLYGYKDGKQVKSQSIAQGGSYSTRTIFDSPKTITLEGEFDEIRVICRTSTGSDYANYGRAITSLNNITIDGIAYRGNTTITS